MNSIEDKKIGFWREYGWESESLKHSFLFPDRKLIPSAEVIDYLQSGIRLVTKRMMVNCIITEQIIGGPCCLTDGEWFWTIEYIFYLKKGMVKLPNELLTQIKDNNYQIPSKEHIGFSLLKDLSTKFMQY